MDQWWLSMSQTELIVRLTIVGVVIFLLLLCGCYVGCRKWEARTRNAEGAQNRPVIEMYRPPTYEEALGRMCRRRRQQDDTECARDSEVIGTLLESVEPTGAGDTGHAGNNDTGEPTGKADTENAGEGNVDSTCTLNTGDESGVNNLEGDEVSTGKDEGAGPSTADDSAFKSSVAVETIDECGKRCKKCKIEGCRGKCNVKGGGRRKRAVSWKDED